MIYETITTIMAKNQYKEKTFVAISAAKDILETTCQLFLIIENKISPHGCSVLVEHNSRYYCLSNSHVLNRIKFPEIFFLGRDFKTVEINGDLFFSEPINNEKNAKDAYDVAIMELPLQLANKLIFNGYKFLSLKKAEQSISLLRENKTMIAAFPANKTKFNFKEKKLKFNPLIVRTIPRVKDYSNHGFPSKFHHVVEYPRKSFRETSTGKKIIASKPYGMSGSGLWILVGESAVDYKPYLIGILTEYDENKSLIFSTKIDLYISVMEQVFDNTIQTLDIQVNLTVVK